MDLRLSSYKIVHTHTSSTGFFIESTKAEQINGENICKKHTKTRYTVAQNKCKSKNIKGKRICLPELNKEGLKMKTVAVKKEHEPQEHRERRWRNGKSEGTLASGIDFVRKPKIWAGTVSRSQSTKTA